MLNQAVLLLWVIPELFAEHDGVFWKFHVLCQQFGHKKGFQVLQGQLISLVINPFIKAWRLEAGDCYFWNLPPFTVVKIYWEINDLAPSG